MSIKDVALFLSGFLTLFAIRWLSLYTGKPR
jgi:hypothetical protein